MPKEMFPGFEGYANYDSDAEESPRLPFKGIENIEDRDVYHGAFSTTIELDEHTIVKMSRLQKVFVDEGRARPVMPGTTSHLVSQTPDSAQDQKKVVAELQALAEEKRTAYKFLKEKFGDVIPELKLCVISKSPLQDLERERLLGQGVTQKQVAKIPKSETTLLEVWENADPKGSLSGYSYEELEKLHQDQQFKEKTTQFFARAREVLLEEGAILDLIAGRNGIPVRDHNNRTLYIHEQDDVLDLLSVEGELMFAVRNTSYKDGSLKYFDLYPFVFTDIPKEHLRRMTDLAAKRDREGLRVELSKIPDTHKGKLFMLSYIVFLEKVSPQGE